MCIDAYGVSEWWVNWFDMHWCGGVSWSGLSLPPPSRPFSERAHQPLAAVRQQRGGERGVPGRVQHGPHASHALQGSPHPAAVLPPAWGQCEYLLSHSLTLSRRCHVVTEHLHTTFLRLIIVSNMTFTPHYLHTCTNSHLLTLTEHSPTKPFLFANSVVDVKVRSDL